MTSLGSGVESEGKADRSDCSCSCCPKRYGHFVLLALGMMLIHAMRVSMSVTIVTILANSSSSSSFSSTTSALDVPDQHWTSAQAGLVHSAFYIGYFVTQLPGGYLATRFSAHRFFGGCILASCALNILVPTAVTVGLTFTCVVRLLQGLCEGLLFPSCYGVLRHWSLPEERGRTGSVVLTGAYLGPSIGTSVSGFLTEFYSWRYPYYLFGAIGMVWFIFWLCLAYEKPSEHPTISEDERTLIEKRQGASAITYGSLRIPVKSILTSLPMYAICLCHFARSAIFFFLLTNEPTYLSVFGFPVAENGALSALPFIIMSAVSLISGLLADILITNPLITRTHVRKMLTCIGYGVESVCFLLLYFTDMGTIVVFLLTVGFGSMGLTVSGWNINHFDLAPRFAGILVALSTDVGVVAGIIMPILVGVMTTDQSVQGWQNVMLMLSIILAVAAVFYGIFGSGEQQSWAEPRDEVNVISSVSPLTQKPYGTFKLQDDLTTVMNNYKQKSSSIDGECQ